MSALTAWPLVALGDLGNLDRGRSKHRPRNDPRLFGGPYPFIQTGDVSNSGGMISAFSSSYSDFGLQQSKLWPAGTLCITIAANIAKTGILGFDACFPDSVVGFTPGPRVISEFVRFCLDRLQPEIERSAPQLAQKNINLDILRKLPIPLPPLDEQRRIVDILNHAASIRRLRDEARAKALEVLPALFADMFGDGPWPRLKIEELLADHEPAIRTGPFGSQLHHDEFIDEGVPVLAIDNVVTNKFRWTKQRCLTEEKYKKFERFRVFPGDIAITIMGTTGRVAVMPHDLPLCMSTKHLCIVSFDKARVVPAFAWGALRWDGSVRSQVRHAGHGAIMEGWNMTIIRGLRIPVPPLALQQEFAERVAEVEGMSALNDRAATAAEQMAQSLMAQMFGQVA